MTKFEIVSDLHLDHFQGSGDKGLEFLENLFKNPHAPNLLIAGDLGFQNDFYTSYFFTLVKRKYDKIVCVLGNHDYWNYSLNAPKIWKQRYQKDNIFILEKESLLVENVNIFGTTLWSKLDPLNVPAICSMVKDFKLIEEFSDCQNYYKAYEESLTALKMFCKKPCLIITHHSPIFLNNRHKNSILESAFCNSLENLVLESNIKAWIFGHVHEKVDTFIGKTHLVNNSFGYFWQNKVTNFKLKEIEIW